MLSPFFPGVSGGTLDTFCLKYSSTVHESVLCIKMSLRKYLVVVICGVFIASGAVTGQEVMRAVGGEVSFKLDKIVPPVTSITWKHLKAGELTVKAIEWEDGETTILNSRFKGITELNKKTGQITISKLTVAHTGVYTIDVSGKEQTQRFTLTVMDRVPKPVIGREKINPDVVYLSCKYNGSITWSNSAGETLIFHSNTDSITVKKNEGNPDNTYNCTLKNAVSEETSDPVYKKDLFNDESTSGPWWIAIIVLILIILIIGIIFAVYRYKHNKDFEKLVDAKCPCIKGLCSPPQPNGGKTDGSKDSTVLEPLTPVENTEAAKDPAKDPAKEAAKDPAKEAAKDPAKEAA